MTQLNIHPRVVRHERRGVSLIEVIVSMFILSLGVMLVATLLPISILRTAQASQLTNAVFLKNNAEAVLDFNPAILGNTSIPFPLGSPAGTVVTAVVDPLGMQLGLPGNPGHFGPPALSVSRFSGGLTTLPAAELLSQLPDSWTTQYEGPVAAISGTPPCLTWSGTGSSASISGITPRSPLYPSNVPYRMIISNTLTGQSAAVPLTLADSSSTPTKLYWWTPTGAGTFASAGFVPAFTPNHVRIDSMQRRFTCMLTVRKEYAPQGVGDTGWSADVECAVFFNRSFSQLDEQTVGVTSLTNGFDGKPGTAGVDDDNNGTPDDNSEIGWPGTDDNRTVIVNWVTAGAAPYLKKGGFMLEPTQLKWYRIINIAPFSQTSTQTSILLDQDLRAPAVVSSGIFMKGVVDVYPLSTITGK